MAIYAYTYASSLRRPVKLMGGRQAMLSGKVTISNYNQTLVAIPEIYKKFKSVTSVVAGLSSGGNVLEWVDASHSFKARVMSTAAEVASDVGTIGTFYFTAYGTI